MTFKFFTIAILALTSLQTAHAQNLNSIELTEIIKRSDWKHLILNATDADKMCKENGFSRLPTVRDLAQYAQTLGAKGIRETAFPSASTVDPLVQNEMTQMRKDGYFPVYVRRGHDDSGWLRGVSFYYNHSGYQPPTMTDNEGTDEWFHWIYSASHVFYGRSYVLNDDSGELILVDVDGFNYQELSNDVSIRCVK